MLLPLPLDAYLVGEMGVSRKFECVRGILLDCMDTSVSYLLARDAGNHTDLMDSLNYSSFESKLLLVLNLLLFTKGVYGEGYRPLLHTQANGGEKASQSQHNSLYDSFL